MAVQCDPSALAQLAGPFQCLTAEQHLYIQTYLLAKATGETLDPNVLMEQAKCFRCIPPGNLLEVQNMLLCKLLTQLGG